MRVSWLLCHPRQTEEDNAGKAGNSAANILKEHYFRRSTTSGGALLSEGIVADAEDSPTPKAVSIPPSREVQRADHR